jgi:small conductance mechanosensitive channel
MNEPDIAQQAGTWIESLKALGAAYGLRVLGALLLLVFGWWLASALRGALRRVLTKRDFDPIITSFIVNLTYVVTLAFVFVSVLSALGVQTASFAAVIAAAGLAVALSLQGSLANFAAGFLLIIFRPFKKGDYIEAAGTAGLVEEIQVFTTVLKTPDNKRVIAPNSSIMGGNIVNFSANETRRVDWSFGVSYSSDIDQVKATIRRVIAAEPRLLTDPPPMVVLGSLGDSSVNFTVRAWAKVTDFWPVFFAINEQMKKTFDAEGITIPFPQRDVHLYQQHKP